MRNNDQTAPHDAMMPEQDPTLLLRRPKAASATAMNKPGPIMGLEQQAEQKKHLEKQTQHNHCLSTTFLSYLLTVRASHASMEPLVEIMELMATETTTCNAADSIQPRPPDAGRPRQPTLQTAHSTRHGSMRDAPGMSALGSRPHAGCQALAAALSRSHTRQALRQWHDWQADS
jgi:hypothetical protein